MGCLLPLTLKAPIHEPEVEAVLAQADALVVLGSQLDGMNTKNWGLPWPATIVVVDADLGGQAPCYLTWLASMAIETGQADTIVIYRALNGRSGARVGGMQFHLIQTQAHRTLRIVLRVRSGSGEMIPLSTVVKAKSINAPEYFQRYNIYRAASINGAAAPGYSSGQAAAAMEDLERILREREPLYAQADVVVDTALTALDTSSGRLRAAVRPPPPLART